MTQPAHAQDARTLCHLGDEALGCAVRRDPLAALGLARAREWLIDRVADRLAARWPEAVDAEALRRQAWLTLLQAAASVASVEDLDDQAAAAIDERMRDLLIASEWYRQAVVRRVRPLCDAWRGALLAGRQPSDHTLCGRLRIGTAEIAGYFAEAAVVFLVDPAALLPTDAEACLGIAGLIVDLPSDQQLAIALYFEHQLTITEIADVLSIDPLGAQELLGRGGMGIVAQAGLAQWPGATALSA